MFVRRLLFPGSEGGRVRHICSEKCHPRGRRPVGSTCLSSATQGLSSEGWCRASPLLCFPGPGMPQVEAEGLISTYRRVSERAGGSCVMSTCHHFLTPGEGVEADDARPRQPGLLRVDGITGRIAGQGTLKDICRLTGPSGIRKQRGVTGG